MPATVHNFNEQLAATTDMAVNDKLLMYDTSAAISTTVTPIVLGVGGGAPVAIADAATYAVLTANNGKVHVVASLSQDVTITLPTPAAGLNFEFWYCSTAAEGSNIILTTASDTNYYVGGVSFLDTDSGSGADEIGAVYSDGNSNSKLTLVTPDAGTWVKVVSDGTLWYLTGQASSASVATLGDQ